MPKVASERYRQVKHCALNVGWIVIALLPAIYLLWQLRFGVAGLFFDYTDFVDLTGAAAERQLGASWPEEVDPASVSLVSYRSKSSRDSFSSWLRAETNPETAAIWIKSVHDEEAAYAKHRPDHLEEGIEGVHRTIPGPPSMNGRTGDVPEWWTPPHIQFEATELMLWYKRYDSGVGQGTYTSFDERTGTLWIYSFACQHFELWEPGELPEGEVISRIDEKQQ